MFINFPAIKTKGVYIVTSHVNQLPRNKDEGVYNGTCRDVTPCVDCMGASLL